MNRLVALLLVVTTAGCLRFPRTQGDPRPPRCLVLDEGLAAGVHVGVFEAWRDAGAKPDCLVATGDSALVATVYAADPERDPEVALRLLRDQFAARKKVLAKENRDGAGYVLGIL